MFQSLRTVSTTTWARSLMTGPATTRTTPTITTSTTTPAVMASSLSTTSSTNNILLLQTNPTVERCDTLEMRNINCNQGHSCRHTEQTWENYGFDRKECGWGAWYLVP